VSRANKIQEKQGHPLKNRKEKKSIKAQMKEWDNINWKIKWQTQWNKQARQARKQAHKERRHTKRNL